MSGVALLCFVIAISDGDTLKARCGTPGSYQQLTVRLAEIDAPEKAQPFGQRSRQHLADLCFQTEATIRPTSKDRYGRTVARVQCRGQDASIAQAGAGMAWAYTRYLTDPEIQRQQDAAKASRAGLWADPSPIPPWDWRSTSRPQPPN